MALYLGSSEELNVILNGVIYHLNMYETTVITNGVKLLSSEGYILKDSNNIYLTAKEGSE